MHERFREGWRAAGYVGGGLQADFRNALFKVVYTYHEKSHRRTCTSLEVGNVIEEFCRKFPQASVDYYLEGEFEYVAEVRCHCKLEKRQGCCRHGKHHRAKIHIYVLGEAKAAEGATGAEATKPAPEQQIAFGG